MANSDDKAGHRRRLKDKFLENGLTKFTDEEIIELLLIFGTPRRDCKQAARNLLKEFGAVRGVFEADREDLARVKGVGPSNVVAVKFIHAVAGKYLEQRLVGRDYLSSSQKVMAYLRHHLENSAKEIFKVIHLDSANGVISLEDCSEGTVAGAFIHPREVIERALVLKAVGLVFVHNHPSGRTKPSPEDYRLTKQLLHAAYLVEMKVVDHLIIGKEGDYHSFRDAGSLARYEKEIKSYYSSG